MRAACRFPGDPLRKARRRPPPRCRAFFKPPLASAFLVEDPAGAAAEDRGRIFRSPFVQALCRSARGSHGSFARKYRRAGPRSRICAPDGPAAIAQPACRRCSGTARPRTDNQPGASLDSLFLFRSYQRCPNSRLRVDAGSRTSTRNLATNISQSPWGFRMRRKGKSQRPLCQTCNLPMCLMRASQEAEHVFQCSICDFGKKDVPQTTPVCS